MFSSPLVCTSLDRGWSGGDLSLDPPKDHFWNSSWRPRCLPGCAWPMTTRTLHDRVTSVKAEHLKLDRPACAAGVAASNF